MRFDIHKSIFACLFSVHNTISFSRHEQVCLITLGFERYFSHHQTTKKRQIRKFNELTSKNKVTQGATNIADKKCFINMSSKPLTHIKTDLLAKYLNVSITSTTLPNKDTIATVEDPGKDLKKEEADTIHAKVSLTLQKG